MQRRLSLGRYIPGNSVMHRMDSRFKLVLLLFLVGCVFAPQEFTGFFFLAVTIAILFLLSHLRLNVLWRLVRPFILIFLMLWLVNCFLLTDTTKLIGWHVGKRPFVISEKGLLRATYISVRVFLMMTLTIILTSTTKPLALTLALEWILSPLKLVRIPVHIIAIIMAIALRMVPTLIDEAGRIINAQASRGVDFHNGRLREKAKAMVSLIVPLLVSSFQKAEDLAYAMDTRGYDPRRPRTRYRKFVFAWSDLLIFLVFIGLGVMIAVNIDYPFLIHALNRFFAFMARSGAIIAEE